MAQHSGRAELIAAQAKAQIAQLESASAAQAQLASGMAQAQIMLQLQSQGIDPLRLKALEAMQTFAATPGQGAVIGTDPRAALFGQMAVAALAPGPSPVAPVAALPSAAPPIAVASPESPEDVERQIDALVERLAEGKISEDTYHKLVARLEAKLTRLRGA
jgi:hypothetical protein